IYLGVHDLRSDNLSFASRHRDCFLITPTTKNSMLRITEQDSSGQVTLKLEGNLAGAWVAELEDSWRTVTASLAGRWLCLDLTAVDDVDRAGKYLLALLHRSGTQLRASGIMMTELIRSIADDWPLDK